MSGMVRRDAIKAREVAAPVELTMAELEALCQAAYAAGRGLWISRSEIAAIEQIIAARLAAVTQ